MATKPFVIYNFGLNSFRINNLGLTKQSKRLILKEDKLVPPGGYTEFLLLDHGELAVKLRTEN